MSLEHAAGDIASIGAFGDHSLPDEAFNYDDRGARIDAATSALIDWVSCCLIERSGDDPAHDPTKIFKREHIPFVARLVAVGMEAQFEHDRRQEGELVAGMAEMQSEIG